MKNLKQITLILLVIQLSSSQLSRCMDTAEFEPLAEQYIDKPFNLEDFRARNIPDRSHYPSLFLGKGSFGNVFKSNVLAKDKQTKISIAAKAIRYDSGEKGQLNNELSVLQQYSNKYPLELVRYFSCYHSASTKTAIIFTERLDNDLDDRNWLLNEFPNYRFRVKMGIFLTMARSIKAFHDNKKAHLDIKPGNFMLMKKTEPIIAKAIDFGLVKAFDRGFEGGTPYYVDPYIFKSYYSVTPKSDIFSLGYTYVKIFDSFAGLSFPESCVTSGFSSYERCNKTRRTQLSKKYAAEEKTMDENAFNIYHKYHQLILAMINLNKDDRPTIDTVIKELNEIIALVDSDNIYLDKNMDSLRTIKGLDITDQNTPIIHDKNTQLFTKDTVRRNGAAFNVEPQEEVVEMVKANGITQALIDQKDNLRMVADKKKPVENKPSNQLAMIPEKKNADRGNLNGTAIQMAQKLIDRNKNEKVKPPVVASHKQKDPAYNIKQILNNSSDKRMADLDKLILQQQQKIKEIEQRREDRERNQGMVNNAHFAVQNTDINGGKGKVPFHQVQHAMHVNRDVDRITVNKKHNIPLANEAVKVSKKRVVRNPNKQNNVAMNDDANIKMQELMQQKKNIDIKYEKLRQKHYNNMAKLNQLADMKANEEKRINRELVMAYGAGQQVRVNKGIKKRMRII